MNVNFYQGRNGLIYLNVAQAAAPLTVQQVLALKVDVSSLEDFDHEAYLSAYHLDPPELEGFAALSKRLRRRELLRQLVDERKTLPYSAKTDAEITLLTQIRDEAEDYVMSYEYRKPRKYLGIIATLESFKGNVRHITLDTEGGPVFLEVDYSESLQEFLKNGYDEERHQRYSYGVDTTLVASVQGTTLVAAEWLYPWNIEQQEPWFMTDDACFQCCRVVQEQCRVYEFIQMNELPGDTPRYRISEGLISMADYSLEQITALLKANGYGSPSQFRMSHGGEIPWRLIAEMAFEAAARTSEMESQKELSIEEAKARIERRTKLSL